MYTSTPLTQQILASAEGAARAGRESLIAALHELPAPIYVTDREGVVTYFNPACIRFSGRNPAVGKDRWCVTWKLYTEEDEFLPHEACPMAVAIKQGRPVRGVTAVAERPDGARVAFLPFPTPLFDADGELIGAVNMLIDITEVRQIPELSRQAAQARRLARGLTDLQTINNLLRLAQDLERKADSLAVSSPYVLAAKAG